MLKGAAKTSIARFRTSLGLRSRIAARLCISTNAVVPGDDRHQRRGLAEQLRRRQVNSVEGANGLHGERLPDSGEHRRGQGHDVAAAFESSERLYRSTLLFGR